jgi:EmrB/QacA subfamily drug resistance transporter
MVGVPDPRLGDAPQHDLRLDTPAGRWILAGTVLGSGIASLDATVVNLALPRIGSGLHTTFAGLQWVVNGYLLTLAAFILLAGSLGDRSGRRRVFVIGVVWFAAASLVCGVAPNIQVLVAARILQGAGGALLTPGSLAIIQSSFRAEDRPRAIGLWSGLGGVTTAIGPFLGGWLVSAASWRWIFLLNLPLSAAVVAIALRHMPESRDLTTTGRVDIAGAVLGAAGLAGLTAGLIERTWPLALLGVVVIGAFVATEARRPNPMLPVDIFRSRQFSATNAVTLGLYAALGMVFFLLSFTLQRSLGYSPLTAGMATLPITILMLAGSARAGALAQRIGPRIPMSVGPAIIAVSLVLLVRVTPGRPYWSTLLPAIVLFGVGLALTVSPLTATALATAEARHAGVASGVNNALARTGGLLAVSAVPLIAGFNPSRQVSAHALVTGFHRAMVAGAGLCGAAALLAWVTIRSDALAPAAEPGAEPGAEPARPRTRQPAFHCGVAGPPLLVQVDDGHGPPQSG